MNRSLSILVHADTKVGKSTFANTAPAPRLLLDTESAARFLSGTKVYWDPLRQEPPVPDGTWDTCVVTVRDYETFTRAYDWLNSGQHYFRSVVIDSVSELQDKCKYNLAVDGRMTMQLWGDLLAHMGRMIRNFRDLTEHPTKPIEAVVLTAMTQMRDGKYRPYVQGQLQTQMPYFMDVIGYMYVDEDVNPADPSAPVTKCRRMLTAKHVQFEAGERVQGRLPDVIDAPTIEGMLTAVFGPLPELAETPEPLTTEIQE